VKAADRSQGRDGVAPDHFHKNEGDSLWWKTPWVRLIIYLFARVDERRP
jgi:hypothetical protein